MLSGSLKFASEILSAINVNMPAYPRGKEYRKAWKRMIGVVSNSVMRRGKHFSYPLAGFKRVLMFAWFECINGIERVASQSLEDPGFQSA
jgi:hypothetical protein